MVVKENGMVVDRGETDGRYPQLHEIEDSRENGIQDVSRFMYVSHICRIAIYNK